mmetsp:Transcript_31234/g.100845  ORF Transcript_31234/g.100845 Transcript_31234/m.100845 type:complete len:237 (+) Transcript_31234:815-1525(+)
MRRPLSLAQRLPQAASRRPRDVGALPRSLRPVPRAVDQPRLRSRLRHRHNLRRHRCHRISGGFRRRHRLRSRLGHPAHLLNHPGLRRRLGTRDRRLDRRHTLRQSCSVLFGRRRRSRRTGRRKLLGVRCGRRLSRRGMRFSVLCRRRLRSRDTRFRLLYYLRMSCCRRLRLSRRLRCYNRLRRRLCLNRRNSRLRLLCSLVLRRLQLALVPALRLGGAGVRAGAVGAERLRQLGLV